MNRSIIRLIAGLIAMVCLLSLLLLPAAATSGSGIVVVLDPGHGGADNGAPVEYNGVTYLEQDLLWTIANHCKAYLETNYENVTVYLTREKDENPDLEERVNFAKSKGAACLVSLHLNTYEDSSIHGSTALVPAGTYQQEQAEKSWELADAILAELEALGTKNRGQTSKSLKITEYPNGGKADSYYLIRYGVIANVPTVIMEQCFLTSPSDFENFLSTEEKLQALAAADARGIANALELVRTTPLETEPVETEPVETEPIQDTTPVTEPVPEETAPAEEKGLGARIVGFVGKLLLGLVCLAAALVAALFGIRAYNIHQYRKRKARRRRRAPQRSAEK